MTGYSPLARRGDPQTSYVAAKQAEGSKHHESIRERILRALDDRDGQTAGEIADYLGLRHEQVWRRVSDLKTDGLIAPRGTRHWQGSGKAQDIMWIVRVQPEQQPRLL